MKSIQAARSKKRVLRVIGLILFAGSCQIGRIAEVQFAAARRRADLDPNVFFFRIGKPAPRLAFRVLKIDPIFPAL
jgi:hypothetical protein